MGFYDLSKKERVQLVQAIESEILEDIHNGQKNAVLRYFSDEDTYIRKSGYLAIGKIHKSAKASTSTIINLLNTLLKSDLEKVRQTTINAAGELGKTNFEVVAHFFDKGLFDDHHSVRNAVIGSIKKMGEQNPEPVLNWAKKYLHHPDKEVRREICHGIELRGRKHPKDILPLLRALEHDGTARVKNTLIHVLGQIAYKKGCLETVVKDLNSWENKELVQKALDEIVDVHHRYRNFAVLTQKQAIDYIDKNYMG
ncbi:HEAT repeat domain-containing protein [Flagellimonas hymeniacidonis]|uniref:HEAT repeat domain-containing protein n=1 Tax=Flagellimonas hymeniacidonis TaxID=2603628 RepID=A0A5C8V352_9FLAO|nr:HEAT repeat domain-containing protein [Flagellimonas hymeniacidonis]TXN34887.1 HEAT repeat domain-containing protein [Flagellimonas hymeniacidonis]